MAELIVMVEVRCTTLSWDGSSTGKSRGLISLVCCALMFMVRPDVAINYEMQIE